MFRCKLRNINLFKIVILFAMTISEVGDGEWKTVIICNQLHENADAQNCLLRDEVCPKRRKHSEAVAFNSRIP